MTHFTKTHNGLDVTTIPALTDNYIYVLSYGTSAAVIDPAEASLVMAFLDERDLQLECIINTHHHLDHIGGNAELKAKTDCRVIGPDHPGIPGLDKIVSDGRPITLGDYEMQVMETPGHARRDLSFYVKDAGVVWTGDTLFTGGCGRLFECDAVELWNSLTKLAALPDETFVYCGHNYTHDNLLFAQHVDPQNEQLRQRIQSVEACVEAGEPTVPSQIADEKATNPFLRVADPAIRAALDMEEASDEEVFAELRRRKDSF